MPQEINWEKVAEIALGTVGVEILKALAAKDAPQSPGTLAKTIGEPAGFVAGQLLDLKSHAVVRQVGEEKRSGETKRSPLYVLAAVAADEGGE